MLATFQNVELSFGSFGHHYTTLDGQRFVTWFDFSNPALKALRLGCRVEYESRPAPTVLCQSPLVSERLPSARLLRVVEKGA